MHRADEALFSGKSLSRRVVVAWPLSGRVPDHGEIDILETASVPDALFDDSEKARQPFGEALRVVRAAC